jgi:hypothetical protein
MGTMGISETSVNFYDTIRRNILGDKTKCTAKYIGTELIQNNLRMVTYYVFFTNLWSLLLRISFTPSCSFNRSLRITYKQQSRYTPWRRLEEEEV